MVPAREPWLTACAPPFSGGTRATTLFAHERLRSPMCPEQIALYGLIVQAFVVWAYDAEQSWWTEWEERAGFGNGVRDVAQVIVSVRPPHAFCGV